MPIFNESISWSAFAASANALNAVKARAAFKSISTFRLALGRRKTRLIPPPEAGSGPETPLDRGGAPATNWP